MKKLRGLSLALFSTVVFGQENCSVYKVHASSALKSYRNEKGVCVQIRDGIAKVDSGLDELVIYSVSRCRELPMPSFCKVPVAELQKADENGNCEVAVTWIVDGTVGAVCTTADR